MSRGRVRSNSSTLAFAQCCEYPPGITNEAGLEVGQAFFVEAQDDAAAGNDNGPANQTGLLGHEANGLAAGGRVFGQVLFAIGTAMGIQEIGVVAGADQLFEFRDAERLLPEVAELKMKAAPLQELARFGAGGAAGFL